MIMAAISDWLAPSLQVASTILSAGGQIARAQTYKKIAARRKALADYEAQQLELEAEGARGVGTRAAQDEALKAANVNSTALARAAASGAGASDPTIMNIISRTAGEGAYRSALAMYEGEAQARLDVMRAQGLRYAGVTGVSDAATAARQEQTAAAATLLSGGVKTMSLYDRFFPKDMKKAANGAGIGLVVNAPTGVSSPRASGSWLDAGTEIQDIA